MLLSCADWQASSSAASLAEQLPRLLGPVGIRCVAARSGDEAQRLLRAHRVHIAVIDLSIPLHSPSSGSDAARAADEGTPEPDRSGPHRARAASGASTPQAGGRLLQLLRRLEAPPPTIVIRPPQPSLRDSARGLSDALREGAFAVLDRPVHLEAFLEAVRRIVARHYAHVWSQPASSQPPGGVPRGDRL